MANGCYNWPLWGNDLKRKHTFETVCGCDRTYHVDGEFVRTEYGCSQCFRLSFSLREFAHNFTFSYIMGFLNCVLIVYVLGFL